MQFSLALANIAHSFNRLALPVEEKQVTLLIDSGEALSSSSPIEMSQCKNKYHCPQAATLDCRF